MKFFWIGPGLNFIQRLEHEGHSVRWYRTEVTNRLYGTGIANNIVRRIQPERDEVVVICAPRMSNLGVALREKGYIVLGGDALIEALTDATYASVLFRSVEVAQHPHAIGGFFDGADWIPGSFYTTVDDERLLTGDLGPIVGPMGTTGFFYKNPRPRLAEDTLLRLTPILKGRGYVGPFAIKDGKPYSSPMQILFELARMDLGQFFYDLAHRQLKRLEVSYDFAVGIFLTIPPFPYDGAYERSPIKMPAELWEHFHCQEIDRDDEGQMIPAGSILGTMTATASTVSGARRLALAWAAAVQFPNLQYRIDVGACAQREIPRVLKETLDGNDHTERQHVSERVPADHVDPIHGGGHVRGGPDPVDGGQERSREGDLRDGDSEDPGLERRSSGGGVQRSDVGSIEQA